MTPEEEMAGEWTFSQEFLGDLSPWIVHGRNRNRQPKIARCSRKEDAEKIATALNGCRERDKQIADQDAYITKLEECMIGFMQDNNGASCNEEEAREELNKMREEARIALEKIKQGDRKL